MNRIVRVNCVRPDRTRGLFRAVFLVMALAVMAALVGCGSDDDEEDGKTGSDNDSGNKVTITTAGQGSCTLSPTAQDNKYAYGTTVHVTATPAKDWRFDHFKNSASNDVYHENPFRIIMTGNISLIAVFVEDDGLDPAENIGATGSPVRGANGYIQIRSFAELQRIGIDKEYTRSDNYELTRDIDATSSKNLNGGEGFLPIGGSNSFTGTFDGKGYTISNLYIFRPLSRAGLLRSNDGIIRNLHIANATIVGGEYVGSLAATNYGTIEDCSSTSGTITGTSSVGGLVGYSSGGQIVRCNSSNYVSGTEYVGGLIGSQSGGTITHNYATGDVKGTSYIGGFVGSGGSGITLCYSTGDVDGSGGTNIGGFAGSGGNLTRCYSTGNVIGNSRVGGFVGYQSSNLLQCYAVGQVSSPIFGDYVGPLIGYRWSGTTTECYWDSDIASDYYTEDCTMCKTTAEMKQQATFTGWDFNTFWAIDEGKSYPYLKALGPTVSN